MFLESSEAEATLLFPYLDLAVVCPWGQELMFIIGDSLRLMNKTLLVDNVALRLPFPNDDLPESLQAESDPSAGTVDVQGVDLVLPDREWLDVIYFLSHKFIDCKFALAVGTGEEAVAGVVEYSLEILAWLSHN
jgi:hypothetical protein